MSRPEGISDGPKGKTQVLGIRLQYGTNYVTFKGNGTVKIEYQRNQ